MPHYSDGTEAKIGDIVKGTTYNRNGVVIGVVTKVVPGTDSCNCVVQGFARKHGDTVVQASDEDYGETKAFTKIA